MSERTDKSSRPLRLKRVLGIPALIVFAYAYMVPLGVFTTYGEATTMSEGHLPAAYVVIIIAMLFTGYAYGRMAKIIPSAGSVYAYARATFGKYLGFASGWTVLADYILLPLLNYLVIGLYMSELFPSIPAWVWILIAILFTTTANILGIKTVTGVNLGLCVAQVTFIAVFILFSIRSILSDGETPSPMDPFISADLPFDGVLAAAAILSLTFLGFDAISAMAEDTKDPQKRIPRAIIASIVIAGTIAIITTYTAHMVYPDWHTFTNIDTAAIDIYRAVGGELLNSFFIALYVAGCMGSAMASQASGSRILFTMGRDGALPKRIFGYLNPKFITPVNAIIFIAVLSCVAFFVELSLVISLISFGALFAYAVVNLCVIKAYVFDRGRTNPGDIVKYGVIPGIGALIVLALWTSLSSTAFIFGLCWAATGVLYLVVRVFILRQPVPDLPEGDPEDEFSEPLVSSGKTVKEFPESK